MSETKGRLLILDLIRFVAAMGVLIFHYKSKYIETLTADSNLADSIYSITKFGYLGVDLFFLVSGFVIFASAMYRTPSQFVISRGTRIYPTFWVCMSFTVILTLVFPDPFSSVSALQYIANLTLFHEYAGFGSIDGVYWTLVVELKFYACIFLLMILGWLKAYRVWLVVWLIATLSFVSFGQPYFMGWFISPEYSPYFMSGIIFYLARREGYNKLYVAILAVAFLLALRHAFIVADSFTEYMSFADRIIVMGIVTSFYFIFYKISRNQIELKYRGSYIILGGMSYPLYLLHNVSGKRTFDYFVDCVSPLPLLILITLAVLGLSFVIHTRLEKIYSNRLKTYLFRKWSEVTKSVDSTVSSTDK
jgi:peptidoglycan/LPS O-acetylase OafA/YrhL